MPHLKKLLILFVVLIATTILSLPSPIHASRQHKDNLSLSPKPQQYELDQEQNMEAPNSSQDKNNNEGDIGLYYNSPLSYAPSLSPSPSPVGSTFSDESGNDDNAPYGDDDDDDGAVPPQANNNNVMPFNYSAEDDAGEFTNEYYSNQGMYHIENKHVVMVVGAVCLVGLGGFLLKRRNQNLKRKQYQNLYYKRDEV